MTAKAAQSFQAQRENRERFLQAKQMVITVHVDERKQWSDKAGICKAEYRYFSFKGEVCDQKGNSSLMAGTDLQQLNEEQTHFVAFGTHLTLDSHPK